MPSGTGPRLPVPMMVSLSSKGQVLSQDSSTAPLTDTSGPETSSAPTSLPASSVESEAPLPVTPDPVSEEHLGTAGSSYSEAIILPEKLIAQAHDAFIEKNFDLAQKLLAQAGSLDPSFLPQINTYQNAVQAAKMAASNTSEQVPSQGGFLVP
jgi:hypothetical protein